MHRYIGKQYLINMKVIDMPDQKIILTGDVRNPIYKLEPSQGLELRRLFAKAVDLDEPKAQSMANRLIYADSISHRSLYYILCQLVDHGSEEIPSWIYELFELRNKMLTGILEAA